MQHDLNNGRNFVGQANTGPMDQTTLDATLMAGNPLEVGFSFQGGGHALFIGGCSAGKYWVHDPWSFDGLPVNNWKAYSYAELLQFTLAGKPCTWTAHVYSTDPGPAPPAPPTPPAPTPPAPTPPIPPAPTPPAPPTPTPPGPSAVCNPDAAGGCTVCGACCKSYLKNQDDCHQCAQQECPVVCDSAAKGGCTVCSACCKSYLKNQDDCTACAKSECSHPLIKFH